MNNNTLPSRGNYNCRSGNSKKFDELVRGDLMEYFKGMEKLSEPRSTRVIRHVTGCTLRDGEDGITYLPNYLSKRGLYSRFCTERGWTLVYLEKGDYKATAQNDVTSLPICSLFKFCSFWKENYPKLRVGLATEDICTMCHVFHNKMKYKLKEKEDADKRSRAAVSNRDDNNDNVTMTDNDSDDDEITNNSNNE